MNVIILARICNIQIKVRNEKMATNLKILLLLILNKSKTSICIITSANPTHLANNLYQFTSTFQPQKFTKFLTKPDVKKAIWRQIFRLKISLLQGKSSVRLAFASSQNSPELLQKEENQVRKFSDNLQYIYNLLIICSIWLLKSPRCREII